MKRSAYLITLLISLGLSLAAHDAEARRLGGGMSSGMKRDSSITQRSATPAPAPAAPTQNLNQAARPAPAATPAPTPPAPQLSGMRRWLGPLAGLAAGVGLAALFSHLGMGAEMGSFLMLLLGGVAIFLVIRLLMNRAATPSPQLQPSGAGGYNAPQRFEPVAMPAGGAATAAPAAAATSAANVPAGFDSEGFLRQAKLNFIRLQAANDRGDMDDVRQFTAPELFAEIRMQYQERGGKAQETDVMQLEAEVLEVVSDGANHVASVRFFGTLREDGGAPESFAEVWHLAKPVDGSRGWTVAGIQQG